MPNLRQPRSAARCSVCLLLLSPPVPYTLRSKSKNRLTSPFGGSRLRHWLRPSLKRPKGKRASQPLHFGLFLSQVSMVTISPRLSRVPPFMPNFKELRNSEVQLRRIPLLRGWVNKLDSWVLTGRPSGRISISDNSIAKTPNSRVVPGGGGPTRTQGPRGESLGWLRRSA